MSVDEQYVHRLAAPTLPRSIWVAGWAMLAAQIVFVLAEGIRDAPPVELVVSAALGGLLLGLAADGITRGRTAWLVVAGVGLGLTVASEVVRLVSADGAGEAVLLALHLAALGTVVVALWRFSKTEFFSLIRGYPSASRRVSRQALVVIGVAVGVLGGVVEIPDSPFVVTLGE